MSAASGPPRREEGSGLPGRALAARAVPSRLRRAAPRRPAGQSPGDPPPRQLDRRLPPCPEGCDGLCAGYLQSSPCDSDSSGLLSKALLGRPWAIALRPVGAQVVRKNRSAGVSPASEPRQLLLGQHDLCRLEAGDTFFLTTAEKAEVPSLVQHLARR